MDPNAAMSIHEEAGMLMEWSSGRSFRLRRPGTEGRKFSLCTATKGRIEARKLASIWRQASSVEIVVAEFGPEPYLVFTPKDLMLVDCYVYGYCPWSSPFAPSWWKNVAAYASTGEIILQVDCDIAVSPEFYDWVRLPTGNVMWPDEISECRDLPSSQTRFDDLKIAHGAVNYERVFCWYSSDMRRFGGWPEWYTGRMHTWMLLRRQVRGMVAQKTCPSNYFAHVPSLKVVGSSSDERSRRPLWKPSYRSCWNLEKDGEPQAFNAEWPIEGWVPGRPSLYEEFLRISG